MSCTNIRWIHWFHYRPSDVLTAAVYLKQSPSHTHFFHDFGANTTIQCQSELDVSMSISQSEIAENAYTTHETVSLHANFSHKQKYLLPEFRQNWNLLWIEPAIYKWSESGRIRGQTSPHILFSMRGFTNPPVSNFNHLRIPTWNFPFDHGQVCLGLRTAKRILQNFAT